ncbi:MAG TPA: hypothetical protein RMF84_10940, partial [Polyangiaceae bacterium LLY-WYZ-14_1]|nr:hypothetical protein [Polyangiaceae bacterium LLY-WYZ-14_1]
MTGMVPAGTLRAPLAGLDALGLLVAAIARRAGLPASFLGDAGGGGAGGKRGSPAPQEVPAELVGRLWDAALAETGDEAL